MIFKKYTYIILIGLIVLASSSYAQSNIKTNDSLFSQAISKNIKKYTQESDLAYRNYDFERGQHLFDSIVNNCLKSTHFNNFKAKKLSGKIIDISNHYKKPTLIVTYSSWCIIPEGEINAINDIATKYHEDIEFVILFWDNKKNAKKASKPFNNKISILHIDEKENVFSYEIKNLKHTFGFPTSFFLDRDNKISNIVRPKAMKNPINFKLKSYDDSYSYIVKDLLKISPNIKIENSDLATN